MRIWVDVGQEELRVKILAALRSGGMMNGHTMTDPAERSTLIPAAPVTRIISRISADKEPVESDGGPDPTAITIIIFPEEHDVHPAGWNASGVAAALLESEIATELIPVLKQVTDHDPHTMVISRRLLAMLCGQRFDHGLRPAADLTRREKEVLTYLGRGATYKIAGHELGISPETVRGHVKNIYRKLNVRSQTEAVFKAVCCGIIQLTAFF